MQDEGAEKSEKPTPRRREKAREDGQVPLAQDVGVAGAVLVLALGVYAILPWRLAAHLEATKDLLSAGLHGPLNVERAIEALRIMGWRTITIFGPVALVAMFFGTLLSAAQVGIYVNWENAGLKWKRLDPSNWLKKVFSVELPVNILKSGFKGLGVVIVAFFGVHDLPERLWRLSGVPAGALVQELQEVALAVIYRVAAALAILAIFDVFWTRYRHEQKLMMSRQEIKDELKDSEGNPQVKGAMRRRMSDSANKRLKELVGEATVVTTNPTHFAVALRYWRGVDVSPVVLAKGADYKAQRIREYARELGVPVIEDKPLARALHALVEEGQNVPIELYQGVARLLAVIYRRRGYLKEVQR